MFDGGCQVTSGLFCACRIATIFLYAIQEEQIYISAIGNICLHADHQRKLNSKQSKYKHCKSAEPYQLGRIRWQSSWCFDRIRKRGLKENIIFFFALFYSTETGRHHKALATTIYICNTHTAVALSLLTQISQNLVAWENLDCSFDITSLDYLKQEKTM